MEIQIVDYMDELRPKVGNLRKGTMLQFQGHKYIKMSKTVGSGLSINWPKGNSILFNPRQGTIRAIDGDMQVIVLHPVEPLKVHEVISRETIGLYTKF
jgi:hypothetical protein